MQTAKLSFFDKIDPIAYAKSRFQLEQHWLVKQKDQNLWHYNAQSGDRYPWNKRPQDLFGKFMEVIANCEFWILGQQLVLTNDKLTQKTAPSCLIFDSATGFVWHYFDNLMGLSAEKAQHVLATASFYGLSDWILPNKDELLAFRKQKINPANTRGYGHSGYRLLSYPYWLCKDGALDTDLKDPVCTSSNGLVFAYNDMPSKDPMRFWDIMYNQKNNCHPVFMQHQGQDTWDKQITTLDSLFRAHFDARNIHESTVQATPIAIPNFNQAPDQNWISLSFKDLWSQLIQDKMVLVSETDDTLFIDPFEDRMRAVLDIDYTPCRLPKLDPVQITDINRGLWELYGDVDETKAKDFGWRSRDPSKDIQEQWVAIDFGTSSTVVAFSTHTGSKELIRVGVRNFSNRLDAAHFENPTALEFIDLPALLSVWRRQMYRPALNWAWVCAANEALEHFREGSNNPRIINSVLRYIKRWARECERVGQRIVDSAHGTEMELSALQDHNPVRGQLMVADPDSALDVVELYAWYLGMAINQRSRGLYLKYAMTFPVKYERAVKDKILASFRRGLQRSLPESLLRQSEFLNKFTVEEVATEPMAYAAAMLPELGLTPSAKGLHYAVFDFGGGTTDFDFGVWRTPTPAEADNGYENVFERLGAGGDPYLGGENLLGLLAYQAVQDNLDTVLEHGLVFTQPPSEPKFGRYENVLDKSTLAEANTAMLMHRLRPILEHPEQTTEHRFTLDLLNRHGQSEGVNFEINSESLISILRQRIERGVEGFLSELHAAFNKDMPQEVHILLAGNASRGTLVKNAFAIDSEFLQQCVERYFIERIPQMIVHFAPEADQVDPYKPSCKTAVALGALDLVRGSEMLQVDRLQEQSNGDAPFKFFCGSLRQGVLYPVFVPGSPYMEWHEMGVVRGGVFTLVWSASPRARSDMRKGDAELQLREVEFANSEAGYRCFGRIISTGEMELRTATSLDRLDHDSDKLTIRVSLEGAEA